MRAQLLEISETILGIAPGETRFLEIEQGQHPVEDSDRAGEAVGLTLLSDPKNHRQGFEGRMAWLQQYRIQPAVRFGGIHQQPR